MKKDKQYVKYAKNYGETIENPELFEDEGDDDELFDIFKHQALKKVGYVDPEADPENIPNNAFRNKPPSLKDMEMNIEQFYEEKAEKKNKKSRKPLEIPKKSKVKLAERQQFELESS